MKRKNLVQSTTSIVPNSFLRLKSTNPVSRYKVRIARVAYPKSNIYLQLRDELGTTNEDEQFVILYPRQGQPDEAPIRIKLKPQPQLVAPSSPM